MSTPGSSFPSKSGAAQGTISLGFRSQHKHKTGISWPWPPATPCPLSCASGWYSHSLAPSPAACCSFKLPSGSLHTLPISQRGPWAPERQTQNMSGCCGRSRLMPLLISPSPRALSRPPGFLYTYHSSFSCPATDSRHHPEMPVVFVGFHPLLIKPIFIQYAVQKCVRAWRPGPRAVRGLRST